MPRYGSCKNFALDVRRVVHDHRTRLRGDGATLMSIETDGTHFRNCIVASTTHVLVLHWQMTGALMLVHLLSNTSEVVAIVAIKKAKLMAMAAIWQERVVIGDLCDRHGLSRRDAIVATVHRLNRRFGEFYFCVDEASDLHCFDDTPSG